MILAIEGTSAIRKSLAEAAAWCRMQSLTAETQESDDIRHRRKLVADAGRLMSESYHRTGKIDERAKGMFREANLSTLIFLRDQLRSPALKPNIDLGELVAESAREKAVNSLIEERAALLKSQCLLESLPFPSEEEGKLLAYFPSENVSDGGSEYSSNGFFDGNDAPPWDTWFHYSDRQLLSWVPSVLVPLAQKGIDGNVVDCIQWAEWSILSRL